MKRQNISSFPKLFAYFFGTKLQFLSTFLEQVYTSQIACVIDLKWNQPHSIFGRLLQKLFWRAPYFQSIIQKAKTKLFIFIGEWKRGASPQRGLAQSAGALCPLSFSKKRRKVLPSCFLNDAFEKMGAHHKKVSEIICQQLRRVSFHSKSVTPRNFAKKEKFWYKKSSTIWS